MSDADDGGLPVRTDYDRLADRYDDDRERFSVPRDDVIDELLGSRSGVRVLDLGCGTGTWAATQTAMFSDPRLMVLGADPFFAMLAGACAKGVSRVACARAEHLPFADATIDYLVSSFNFHHFSDKQQALNEVSRVLAVERGVFRINNIEPDAAEGWWVYQYFPEALSLDAARFWSADRIAAALEARGFQLEVDRQPPSAKMAAPDALADAERRVISELVLLDDDVYARGLARLRHAAAQPGSTVTTAATLRLTARRSA